MVKAIVYAGAILPIVCLGQSSRFETSVSVPLLLKVSSDFNLHTKSSLLGATGVEFATKISGSDENAMSFLQIVGLMDDKRSFQTEPGSKITTGLFFLNVNPSVLVKTKWDNLKIIVGIGGLINIGQSIASSTSTQSSGTYYSNVDSIDNVFKNNSVGVIPYVSVGAMWTLAKHLKVQVVAEPTLLNFYDADAKITYNINYSLKYFPLSYQPIYFGLRFFYFFK